MRVSVRVNMHARVIFGLCICDYYYVCVYEHGYVYVCVFAFVHASVLVNVRTYA